MIVAFPPIAEPGTIRMALSLPAAEPSLAKRMHGMTVAVIMAGVLFVSLKIVNVVLAVN